MDNSYKFKFLKKKRLQVLLAVADCIVPQDKHSPGGGTLETAAVIDWAIRRLPAPLRSQFLLLFSLVDYMGIFFGGRRFVNNNRTARERQLKWMETCFIRPLRIGFFGLKSYVCMGYYTRESIWPTINYDGPVETDRPYAYPALMTICRDRRNINDEI